MAISLAQGTYDDPIYGPANVTEPVLVDLVDSAALQRLDGILQHGISGLIGITTPISRLEHSIGTMLLVRRLSASLEEQIAALLHDVSHTVFSHVIDYVFDGHDSQDFHEEKKEAFIERSELPDVLAKHGFEWRDFLDETAFTLLEQPAPRLCADRLDYFLRDSVPLGLAVEREVASALEHLVVVDGRIVTDTLEAASWMGYTYLAADDASWANLREVGLYELTARAIKRALKIGAMEEADLWMTDLPIWAKLVANPDSELQENLRLVSPDTRFSLDDERPTFRVSTKLRSIDPDVLVDGRLMTLSSIDEEFKRYRDEYLRSKRGRWPIRVVG